MKKLFKIFTVILAVIVLSACTGSQLSDNRGNPSDQGALQTAVAFQVQATMLANGNAGGNGDGGYGYAMGKPTATPGSFGDGGNGNPGYSTNAPGTVPASAMDIASGKYKNTLGLNTSGWLAEPGKLLVGSEFSQAEIDRSGGTIERINPVNQTVFENAGTSFFNCPEGGYLLASGAVMTASFGEFSVHLNGAPAHDWLLVVRCRNSDNRRDSDLNVRTEFSDYVAGHIMVMRYPGKPGGGFISQEHFLQVSQNVHYDSTNCGADGCSQVSAFFLDVNTGAYTVLYKSSPSAAYQLVRSNWQ